MTEHKNMHPDENQLQQWLGELPDAEPDAAFRDRLRVAFTTGRIDVQTAPEIPRARRAALARAWRWVGGAAATAAVLAVLILLNQGPGLNLLEATGIGTVRIDGQSLPLEDKEAMSAAIVAGAELQVPPDATVDLVVARTAIYEVTGGTRMTLPKSFGRWIGRAASCSVMVGELRLKTGPRFAGKQLRIFTPEGIVEVTGTLLSVQCDEAGTCVCVLEGTALVGTDDGGLEEVTPGNRKIMMRDGTIDIIPIKPMHRDGVLDFDRRVGQRVR